MATLDIIYGAILVGIMKTTTVPVPVVVLEQQALHHLWVVTIIVSLVIPAPTFIAIHNRHSTLVIYYGMVVGVAVQSNHAVLELGCHGFISHYDILHLTLLSYECVVEIQIMKMFPFLMLNFI